MVGLFAFLDDGFHCLKEQNLKEAKFDQEKCSVGMVVLEFLHFKPCIFLLQGQIYFCQSKLDFFTEDGYRIANETMDRLVRIITTRLRCELSIY